MQTALNYGLAIAFAITSLKYSAIANSVRQLENSATEEIVAYDHLKETPTHKRSGGNIAHGVYLQGLANSWKRTGNGEYFNQIQRDVDSLVSPVGKFLFDKIEEGNHPLNYGRSLLTLYRVTEKQEYYKAALELKVHLEELIKESESGTKNLSEEDLFMSFPFYTEFAVTFSEPEVFEMLANRFALADTKLNKASEVAIGSISWFGASLVEVLEAFPEGHPRKNELLAMFQRFADRAIKAQDPATGLWKQSGDMPLEILKIKNAEASNLVIYALAKGSRLGYLSDRADAAALKSYQAIPGNSKKTGIDILTAASNPYLLAANEMLVKKIEQVGKGKTILLDGYFNNEFKKDVTGRTISWHYKWEEQANGGFSLLGEHARYMGAKTAELKTAPVASALKGADVYIIVDPDTEKETEIPNYVRPEDIRSIAQWVKKGGVLLLMSNDLPNAEFDHFNQLAAKFGIVFKKETKMPVKGTQWDMGKVMVPEGNRIFSPGYPLYLKEVSTLNLSGSAAAELSHGGDVLMATSRYGKGTVFAIGDPWLYNEYIDGRRLPSEYKNMEAGVELIKWLLQQAK